MAAKYVDYYTQKYLRIRKENEWLQWCGVKKQRAAWQHEYIWSRYTFTMATLQKYILVNPLILSIEPSVRRKTKGGTGCEKPGERVSCDGVYEPKSEKVKWREKLSEAFFHRNFFYWSQNCSSSLFAQT